jgi:hypothetical protein
MQNICAPDLFQRKRNPKLKEHDAYILQNSGICPAILAADLDVTERFVVSRQRKLGVRPFTGNPRKGAPNVGKTF